MTELQRALGDISSIRRQVASTSRFQGYGPATLAATGVFAMVAAVLQELYVPDPGKHAEAYLTLWIATAVFAAGLTGIQTRLRARRMHSALSDEMIRLAVEQFLPSLSAGLLLTVVMVRCAPQALWMLPGMWQIMFSLGVFSSCRFLSKAMVVPGIWYLAAGLTCISLGDFRALSSWTMGVSFGVGQFLVALVLRLSASEAQRES